MDIKAITMCDHFDKQIFTFTNSFSKAINMAALFTCFYEAIPDKSVTGAKWELSISQT